jgi:serine/threonine protein kinase
MAAPSTTAAPAKIFHPAVDMWAVGVITYKLLTGQQPFTDSLHFFNHVAYGVELPGQERLDELSVSAACRAFMKECLSTYPVCRMTCHQALRDEWLAPERWRSLDGEAVDGEQPAGQSSGYEGDRNSTTSTSTMKEYPMMTGLD